jgi:hypothetical protein
MRRHNVSDYTVGAVRWRKSTRSYGAGNCVEIAAPGGERVIVRDSNNANGAVLTFSPLQWNAFVVSVRRAKSAELSSLPYGHNIGISPLDGGRSWQSPKRS